MKSLLWVEFLSLQDIFTKSLPTNIFGLILKKKQDDGHRRFFGGHHGVLTFRVFFSSIEN